MDLSNSEAVTSYLQIGITDRSPAWSELLSQIGVAFEVADLKAPDLHRRYSVIIVNGDRKGDDLQRIKAYMEQGGAILDTGPYADYMNIPTINRYIDQILPEPDSPFAYAGRIDLYQTIRSIASTTHLEETVAMPLPDRPRYAFCGWDIEQVFSNDRMQRKSFCTGDKFRQPNEIVNRISKGPVRRAITVLLKSLHFARDLPFLHLWPIPNGKKRFLGFRIDTDYGTKETLDKTLKFADRSNISMSWFLHVEAHKKWLPYFHKFSDHHEIASHGYHHQTYRSYDRNYENILNADHLLEKNGFNVSGFCAPYGLWNPNLQRAVASMRYRYSSEFAYDDDNLPSFPLVNETRTRSLQIPIHPIGTGRLKHAGASHRQMVDYFVKAVNLQFSRHEPIFLYHHPNQQGLEVFTDVLQQISDLPYCNWTMQEYAKWWKKRRAVRWKPIYKNGKLQLSISNADTSVEVAMHRDMQRFSLHKPQKRLTVDNIQESAFSPSIPPCVKNRYKETYPRWDLLKTGILDFINRRGY